MCVCVTNYPFLASNFHPVAGRTKTRSRACIASHAAPTPRTSPADAR